MKLFLAIAVVLTLLPVLAFAGEGKFEAFKVSQSPPTIRLSSEAASSLKDGMSLKEIVSTFGPGWMSPMESAGIIKWFFEDRTLLVWPSHYTPNEVITFKGKSGSSRMWWSDASPVITIKTEQGAAANP